MRKERLSLIELAGQPGWDSVTIDPAELVKMEKVYMEFSRLTGLAVFVGPKKKLHKIFSNLAEEFKETAR
jgi:hypothetical protein